MMDKLEDKQDTEYWHSYRKLIDITIEAGFKCRKSILTVNMCEQLIRGKTIKLDLHY